MMVILKARIAIAAVDTASRINLDNADSDNFSTFCGSKSVLEIFDYGRFRAVDGSRRTEETNKLVAHAAGPGVPAFGAT